MGAFLRIQEVDANARRAAAGVARVETAEALGANALDTSVKVHARQGVRFPRNWEDVKALSDQIAAWALGERRGE